jgi:tetratricopeptide (TPR) repeat protein
MVVSRPDGAGFIDPRSEAQAVLQAIERSAPGRVVVEFLRPATLTNLVERLENRQLPAVDILHFDGHGVFDGGVETGYLLFEDKDGKVERVSAEKLGEALQQNVSLMVLSACESGKVMGEDALGCVAARLTHSGIPAVLAMTYSVLVKTTEQLFGKFYGELAAGQSLGVALANARQDLFDRQRRGKTLRGTEQVDQNLSDWFLPAWYQAGDDIQLLQPSIQVPQIKSPRHELPHLAKEGFFGRSRDLWDIERAFFRKRRLTISGFGGQGKTYLAVEAGRWMSQTGMFDVVCFVNYAAFQGVDPVGFAVWEIGRVLEQSFVDAAAVTAEMEQHRTLLILDNLESLEAEALQELLTVAKEWSEVGATRLLLTTRNRDLNHPDYPVGRSLAHQRLLLRGLGNEQDPEDAINYFQGLMKLSPEPKWELPKRSELIDLFKLVDFHPLSIKLVAYQCKELRVGDLARSLAELLAAEPLADKQRCLIASLNLSLERLPADLSELLLRLGVFHGGAFESMILKVLQFVPEQWQKLKATLLRTGLVQVEEIGLPFLRFHPTLAPVLWGRLIAEKQGELKLRYQQEYYAFANSLYRQDLQNPAAVRIVARRELANLLWAVNGALDDQSGNAVDFVDSVNWFLDNFGLKRDQALLTERLDLLVGTVGSQNWYLVRSSQGEQLFKASQYEAAAKLFVEILQALDNKPSFDRVNTLNRLGRCLRDQGELTQAEECLQTGIKLSAQLDPLLDQSDGFKRQRSNLNANLGDVLRGLGKYEQAQQAYEDYLAIQQELGDQRGVAVVEGKLGILAMLRGDLGTAEQRHQSALQTFQRLQEPQAEAVEWHQLGMVYQEGKQWAAADRAYRTSASIQDQQGNFIRVASTYNQLGILNERMNQIPAAEAWYRKALQIAQKVGDQLGESRRLHNLAALLSQQPDRLPTARQTAEKALAIKQTLDPAAVEIWTTYDLLANIATAQSENLSAQTYRQLARTTKAAFAGTQSELQRYAQSIELVIAAVVDATAREQLEPVLVQSVENGKEQLVAVIRRVLAGEREVEVLWDDLDLEDSMIIAAILRGVSEL